VTVQAPSMVRAATMALAAILLGLVFAACGGGEEAGGGGEKISLRLGAGHPAGGAITYTNFSQDFLVPELEKRVAAETDSTLEISEKYAGTLAPLEEVLEGTEAGLLDIGLVPYPFEPSNLFLWNTSYYVPFGSPDPNLAIESFRTALDANPELAQDLEERWNQKLLGLAGVGNYGLITTFKWDSVSQLRGKKISAAGPNLPWLQPVGAVPVQGVLNEWYTSLDTGVFEGGIMFPEATVGFKLQEVAPNYTETNFGATVTGGIHVNLDTWDDLPQDVRTIFEEVGREYEAKIGEQISKDAEAALETMRSGGAAIRELPEQEQASWASSLPNIPDQRAKEADQKGLPGSKFIGDYLQAMSEFDFPRQWKIE